MSVEETTEYIFIYTPLVRGVTKIRFVTVHIVAKTEEEARLISYADAHRFFDNDLNCEIKEGLKGYREVI